VSALPALVLLGSVATVSLVADRIAVLASIVVTLALLVARYRGRRRIYLVAAAFSGVTLFLFSPLVAHYGSHLLWRGPHLPAPIGWLDVTTEELHEAVRLALRLTALALAFGLFALGLDHDRLVQGLRFARRSMLALAIALRLMPALERDAHGLVEALRGRGVAVAGVRGHARLLTPLLAGSLERALSLAEAMEARGFGRGTRTRAPRPGWSLRDWTAIVVGPILVVVAVLWL
jgi:energy-coupling factor transport system permease protein